MAKKPKFNLLDYVKIRLDDATITLEVIVPLTRWPEPLYDEYGAIVRMRSWMLRWSMILLWSVM